MLSLSVPPVPRYARLFCPLRFCPLKVDYPGVNVKGFPTILFFPANKAGATTDKVRASSSRSRLLLDLVFHTCLAPAQLSIWRRQASCRYVRAWLTSLIL